MPTIGLGPDQIQVSRLALGLMELAGTWNPDEVGKEEIDRAINTFATAIESGFSLFDLADIYCNGASESVFKKCFEEVKPDRKSLFIASKCGIVFEDRHGPYRYDLSFQHVMDSASKSLERMGIKHIDLYQVHRHAPLTHPAETASALNQLRDQGLIRHIGVSNYSPSQLDALQEYVTSPIISTQPEFSLMHIDPMTDGTLDHCEKNNIRPLAYRPLAQGAISGNMPDSPNLKKRFITVLPVLQEIAAQIGVSTVQISLAWILKHPAGVIPVFGSTNPDHIRDAVVATHLDLSRSDWYRLWTVARGETLP